MTIEFTIPGVPQGKGRPRFTQNGATYTPKKTKDEDIFELDGIQDNLLRLNNISEEEVKHIVDIFGSRGLQVVLFPRLVSEE